ncbi:hypothetical protein FKR81_37485 [Lentzea tibetensis]|uniref:DUF3558 domain-containing protein n=1 Tax=Lentzea tibetensis TaxID=2591470 RepID=A0A563EJ61_9PSEU|nr:hypothetical protein [Lentzea tibetensis]TWP46063.1 hypothetical protein FKR81_37485 [Lentzea tibetensis]
MWTTGLLAAAVFLAACTPDPSPPQDTGGEQQGKPQIEQAIPQEMRKDAEAFAKFRQIDACALHSVEAATEVTGDKGDAIMPDDSGFHECALELHKSEFESTWNLRIEVGAKFDARDRHEAKPENIGGIDVFTRELDTGSCSAWWPLDTDQPAEQQKFAIELSTSKPSGDAAGGKTPCDVVKQYLAKVGSIWKELPKRGGGKTSPEFKLATVDPCGAAAAVLDALGPQARLDPVNPSSCTAIGAAAPAADGKNKSAGGGRNEVRVTFGIKDDPSSLVRAGVQGASETTVDGRTVVLSQGRHNSCAAYAIWDPDTTVVVDHSDEEASTATQQIRIDTLDCEQAKTAMQKVLAKVGKP